MIRVVKDKQTRTDQLTFTLNSSKNEIITTGYSKTFFERIAQVLNDAEEGQSFERSFNFSTDAKTKKKFEEYLETQVSTYQRGRIYKKSEVTDFYCVNRWRQVEGNDKLTLTLYPQQKQPDTFVQGLFDNYEAQTLSKRQETKIDRQERTISSSKSNEESKQSNLIPIKYNFGFVKKLLEMSPLVKFEQSALIVQNDEDFQKYSHLVQNLQNMDKCKKILIMFGQKEDELDSEFQMRNLVLKHEKKQEIIDLLMKSEKEIEPNREKLKIQSNISVEKNELHFNLIIRDSKVRTEVIKNITHELNKLKVHFELKVVNKYQLFLEYDSDQKSK